MIRRATVLFFLLLIVLILNAFLNPFPKKNTPEGFRPKYGISYSFEQAGWYGLDARKSYIELLDTAKFDWVRLPFFWDQMMDVNGELKVDDLKFAIEEAQKRNVKVIVALGLKTPYYPEYHLPGSISSQIKFGEKIGAYHAVSDDVLAINKKLVEALSKYDNISHWQVENEPFLANVNNWKIDESLIKAEVEVVRSADFKKRPIILNHVGPSVFDKSYKPLFSILETGDVFGVNAYFKTQGVYLASFKVFGKEVRINWPGFLVWPVQSWAGFSPNFSNLANEAQKKGIELWVLEMQAEPYVRSIENAKSNDLFFRAQDIVSADKYLKSNRIEAVGLWGAHFWQFRKKIGDRSWMDSVKSIVN